MEPVQRAGGEKTALQNFALSLRRIPHLGNLIFFHGLTFCTPGKMRMGRNSSGKSESKRTQNTGQGIASTHAKWDKEQRVLVAPSAACGWIR
mmetsp:Transcript_60789/g.143425  ORF Transcript_60789/g.143425 Transcript_60789/m.143425 type:complete len:92 (-) Transcript_60789:1150-1425(-)